MPTSWDAIYKQVLVRWFERWGVTLVTEVEVARLPRRIDGVAICSPAERQRLAQTSPFDFFRQHNLLEFKSPNDPLTMREYQRVLGRAWFYAAEMEVKDPAEMSLCVVTSRKPVKVLTGSPAWVRFSRLRSGLYRSDDKIPVHLLVVPELPLREENYPLLLFARGRKRREFLRWLIGRKEVECLRWAYELYPQEVKEELIMSKDYPTLEENIRFIIQDIGLKRLLQETEPEELAEAVDLRALARAAGLRRILQEVQPEELAEAVDLRALARAAGLRRILQEVQPEELAEAVEPAALLQALVSRMGREEVEQLLRELVPEGAKGNGGTSPSSERE